MKEFIKWFKYAKRHKLYLFYKNNFGYYVLSINDKTNPTIIKF